MNKRIVLISIIVICLVAILTFFTMKYDWFGLNQLQKDIQTAPDRCASLGGTYAKAGWGQCYDYDEQGYKFYWGQDKNGRYYKSHG